MPLVSRDTGGEPRDQLRERLLALAGDAVVEAEALHQLVRDHAEAAAAHHDRRVGVLADRAHDLVVVAERGAGVGVVGVLDVAHARPRRGPGANSSSRSARCSSGRSSKQRSMSVFSCAVAGHAHHVEDAEREHRVGQVLAIRGDEGDAHARLRSRLRPLPPSARRHPLLDHDATAPLAAGQRPRRGWAAGGQPCVC